MKPVNAHDELQHTIELVRSEASNKSIQIQVQLKADKNTLLADPSRLQQIFWNVIKNSIKFSPEGSVVTIITENIDDWISIRVTDNGIGIDPNQLGKIFNTFQQGSPNMVHQFGGNNKIYF